MSTVIAQRTTDEEWREKLPTNDNIPRRLDWAQAVVKHWAAMNKVILARLLLAFLLLAAINVTWSQAQGVPPIPPAILNRIKDDDASPLPRWRQTTEGQESLSLSPLRGSANAQPREVTSPAEYDRNEGIVVRWGAYNAVLTQLAVAISTREEDAIVHVVVESAAQKARAGDVLVAAGADMGQVRFLLYETDSVWIRDYGPRFILERGTRVMVDHTYNLPRPRDNGLADFLSSAWAVQEYDMPVYHAGGNFQLFSSGSGFVCSLILQDNPTLSEADIRRNFADYLGVIVGIPEAISPLFDATGHIDMWFLPVADDAVIVGEYSPSLEQAYRITEAMAEEMAGRDRTVYRTPAWHTGGVHYTYTNALLFNELAFVPTYGGYPDLNDRAMMTFETALPERRIVPVDCSTLIASGGALHCIALHVPAVRGTVEFLRGDGNADRTSDVADAIFTLSYLFAEGSSPSCLDAADANDDGAVDIGDAIAALSHLFTDSGALPEPFSHCAEDPTVDQLDCRSYPPCED
ncbi:MAG: agmatine deiminase family protein [Armatimonadetes bacterium]|nr:agmatine deiminase family protein [Armatimonadota bacterium]